ncbi:hypothetical protein WJX81_002275 [Elliptochloris bilobata]|uniref:BZIP domain-containing protein n=1 Tax=Elliptochloris bilobata TaxID=381761 RepID=A0AAW1RA86_9CHLO
MLPQLVESLARPSAPVDRRDGSSAERRKEINRNSARRIRLRRVEETEDLRRQVAALRRENGMLLGYSTKLRQEKRELEICQALLAAENLRLSARLQAQTSQALRSEQ